MTKDYSEINRYHQNMFDFDGPNVGWINSCAAYLNDIFPCGLKNKHVVDYGFGRGNWSLAFLEQGAAYVTAIDASTDAVERFSRFANDRGIHNLSVQLGNSDEEPLNLQADVIFLYGILHHVKYPLKLLKSAAGMCANKNSQVLVYAYNANSLRQTIAEIARAAIGSDSGALKEFSLTLHPNARIRAMDDLTAPYVNFWTNAELKQMLLKTGLRPVSQLTDFAAFEGKSHAPEFEPYVFIASPSEGTAIETASQSSPNYTDIEHIKVLANAVLDGLNVSERVQFAVGLYNTSFAEQGAEHYFDRVFAIWRYLVIVGLSSGKLLETNLLPVTTQSLFKATWQRLPLSEPVSGPLTYSDPDYSIYSLIKRGGFRL